MLASSGCGASAPPLSQQVRTWARSTSLASDISTVRGDLVHEASLPLAPGAALRTVCDVLVTDALDANEQLPTPDATLTTLLSRAYTEAAAAGHDCFNGAGGNTTDLDRSVGARQAAERDLVVAQARYDSLISALPTATS